MVLYFYFSYMRSWGGEGQVRFSFFTPKHNNTLTVRYLHFVAGFISLVTNAQNLEWDVM